MILFVEQLLLYSVVNTEKASLCCFYFSCEVNLCTVKSVTHLAVKMQLFVQLEK